MRIDNRPYAMLIDGAVSGLFHTIKQASAAKTAILAAFQYRKEMPPDIYIGTLDNKK